MALPRKSGLASASAITSSLDAASDDVAFGVDGRDVRRGAGEREGGDDLLHLDLRSGPGRRVERAAARREGSGRECVSRGRAAVAPARRYVGPRCDERALAAWFEFVGYSERKVGQAAQEPALLPPTGARCRPHAVRGWLGPKRPGAAPRGPSSSLDIAGSHCNPLRRGAAIALKGLRTALRRRLRLVFAVVVSDAADRRQLLLVSEDKVEAHPSRRASISWPV